MVIMHVVAPCEFGGLERVVQMLGTGFGSLGHEVHVVSVVTESGAAEAFHGPLSEAGVATHEIVLSARSYARERAVIAALCQRLRPDAVHTHGYRPDVVDAGVARQLGRSEEHTSELQSQSNLVCRLLLEKKKKKNNDTDETCSISKTDTDAAEVADE